MKKSIASLAASACFIVLLGAVNTAHAVSATFVSGNGNDSNDCLTPATACRLIPEALSKTDDAGIIHVLPGEYGAFDIVNRSVDIVADAGQASFYSTFIGPISNVTGDASIIVEVGATNVVRIRGFLLSEENGIAVVGSGVVQLEECTFIGDVNRHGIVYAPTGAGELYISDSLVTRRAGNSQGGGILIKPFGSGSAKVVLDNVSVEDNTSGITIDGRSTTGANAVTLRNSTIAGSTTFGVNAIDSGGGATNVMIEGSTFSNNGSQGVISNGANTTVHMRNSTVTGNARGIIFTASGKLISGGGNLVTGNTVNGVFSSSIAQQ